MVPNAVLSICLSNHLSITLIDDYAKITAPLMEIIFKGGMDMEEGIYTRREYRIVLYEKEGTTPFVIVHNDHYVNQPMVLIGENAEQLILSFAACLNKVCGL